TSQYSRTPTLPREETRSPAPARSARPLSTSAGTATTRTRGTSSLPQPTPHRARHPWIAETERARQKTAGTLPSTANSRGPRLSQGNRKKGHRRQRPEPTETGQTRFETPH